jgi:hypothetical protein
MRFQAKKFVQTYGNEKGINTLFWLVAGIVILFFGAKIIRAIKGLFDLFIPESKSDKINDLEDTIEKVKKSIIASNLSMPLGNYKQIADQQEKAMQYAGTDFPALLRGVENLNSDELKQVFVYFGLRYNYTFGITSSLPSNLMGWYRDELSTWSIIGKSQLTIMQEIWNKTGLKI